MANPKETLDNFLSAFYGSAPAAQKLQTGGGANWDGQSPLNVDDFYRSVGITAKEGNAAGAAFAGVGASGGASLKAAPVATSSPRKGFFEFLGGMFSTTPAPVKAAPSGAIVKDDSRMLPQGRALPLALPSGAYGGGYDDPGLGSDWSAFTGWRDDTPYDMTPSNVVTIRGGTVAPAPIYKTPKSAPKLKLPKPRKVKPRAAVAPSLRPGERFLQDQGQDTSHMTLGQLGNALNKAIF